MQKEEPLSLVESLSPICICISIYISIDTYIIKYELVF